MNEVKAPFPFKVTVLSEREIKEIKQSSFIKGMVVMSIFILFVCSVGLFVIFH
jgi:hypothetical protein